MKLKLEISPNPLPPEYDLILQSLALRFPLIEFKRGAYETGTYLPAVCSNVLGQARSFAILWGYPDEKRKRDKLVDAVWVETIEKKINFLDGYLQRRCLIPVSSFLIDGKDDSGNKVWYRVRHAVDEMFYLAAVYRKRSDKPYFVLLTKAAEEKYQNCCSRMPFAVPRERCAEWVNLSRRMKTKWQTWEQNWIITKVDQ